MRDEEYSPEQIPSYSGGEQLALAARMRPQLRMTQIGNVFAGLAVVAAVVALILYPNLWGNFEGRGWAVAAVVCAASLLAICTFQHVCWLLAMAVWEGRSHRELRPLSVAGFVAQIVSYFVVVVALWVAVTAIAILQWTATSAILLMVMLLFMMAAQVLAGIQYVRVTGPPGAVPAHMHKVVERENSPRR
jgi:hypothetical protein